MSVAVDVTLPAQPASGSVALRPLGGDGYSAPQSYYLIDIDGVSDASGGTNTLTVNLDPQYQSVVSLIACRMASGAATVAVQLALFEQGGALGFSVIADMVLDADAGQNLLYSPAPVFPAALYRARCDNVDTETFSTSAIVYNFRRDAFQRTPLNVIFASIPRGFSIQ